MDPRQIPIGERLYRIEKLLQDIRRRLVYLDDVEIPFVYDKLHVLEKGVRKEFQEDKFDEGEHQETKPPQKTVEDPNITITAAPDEEEYIPGPEDEPEIGNAPSQYAREEEKEAPPELDEEEPEEPAGEEQEEEEKEEAYEIPPPEPTAPRYHFSELSHQRDPQPEQEEMNTQWWEDEKPEDMELQIGGKWFLRLGIIFIGLAFAILAFFTHNLPAWLKMVLVFMGGGTLLGIGNYLYTSNARIAQKHLSGYGIWLALGGMEVLYIGAWRTHIPHNFINFELFVCLILGLVALNVLCSTRMKHFLFILQYLTTFFGVCLAVHLNYGSSDPHFPILFLLGISFILALDITLRRPENTLLTLTYSSVLLFVLLGRTGDMMFPLVIGYLIILLSVSHFHRDVYSLLGVGKVPDLLWGIMLTVSYVHILNYLAHGGEELYSPLLFAMVAFGMFFTYYLPSLTTKQEKYRFATDLEFYFITGIFFLIFFWLSPNVLLLLVFLILGAAMVLSNIRAPAWEAPQLPSTRQYLATHWSLDSYYLLNNRIRFHLFLFIPLMVVLPATVAMDISSFLILGYLTGFASITLVTGTIEFRRADENALQILRAPVYQQDGSLESLVFEPEANVLNTAIQFHLPGSILGFIMVLLALFLDDSLLPTVPFLLYLGAVFFLNQAFTRALKRQLLHGAKQQSMDPGDLQDRLRDGWHYQEETDGRFLTLLFSAIVTIIAGLASQRMTMLSLGLFFLLVGMLQMDIRTAARNIFLFRRKDWKKARNGVSPEDFPGLFRDSSGFLLYLPFIFLALAGRFDLSGLFHYGPYLFFLATMGLERFFFPNSRFLLMSRVASVVVLGFATLDAPFSGFAFLATAAAILFLHREEVGHSSSLPVVLPLLFVYVARIIVFIQGENLFVVAGWVPAPLPGTVEIVCILLLIHQTRILHLRNPGWRINSDPEEATIYPRLFALLFLLPVMIHPYHAAVLLVPLVVLYLSLRMNAPLENFLASTLLIWGFWGLMGQFVEGKPLIYATLGLVGMLLGYLFFLEKEKKGNLAVMTMLSFLTMVFMVISSFAFNGGTPTTALWTLLGVVHILLGFFLERRYLRFEGILVVIASAAKLLLYDMIAAPVWARAVTLAIIGIALLGISYLYLSYSEKRDREQKKEQEIRQASRPPRRPPPKPHQQWQDKE